MTERTYTYGRGRFTADQWNNIRFAEAWRRVYPGKAGYFWPFGSPAPTGFDVLIARNDLEYQVLAMINFTTAIVTTRDKILADADA